MFSRGLSQVIFAVTVLSLVVMACNLPAPTGTPTPVPTFAPQAVELPPVLVSRAPERGEELGAHNPVTLVFNAPMDRASVEAAFKITPLVKGEFKWDDDKTLHFVPAADGFERQETYQVTVDTTARGKNGLALSKPVSFRFQAVGYLEVTQVLPAPDATEVKPDSTITVMFNRPVVPLTTIEEQSKLPQPLEFSPSVKGSGEWLNTSIYVFRPESLTPSATYTVKVKAGLTDTAGAILKEDYTWSFTVMAPRVISSWPTASDDYVPLDVAIKVKFNQPMDRASVEAAFGLHREKGGQGPKLPGRFGWDDKSNTMIFTPTQRLELETWYTGNVPAGVKSATGQATMLKEYTWHFFTVPYPRILKTDPADGAQNAETYGSFEIFFSAPIDPKTVMPNVRIAPEPKATDVYTYFSSSRRAFVLSFPRQPSTDYSITIGPDVADPYGNKINQSLTVRFRTHALDPTVYFNVPGQMGTYSAYTNTHVYVAYRNIKVMDFGLYRLPFADFDRINRPGGWDFWNKYSPSAANQVRQWSIESAPDVELNETAFYNAYLAQDGGALPPGLYYFEATSPQVTQRDHGTSRHILIVGTANVLLKAGEREGMVWVTDLHSGQPVANAPVVLYDENFAQMATGQTDADGIYTTYWDSPRDVWQTMYAVVGQPFRAGVFGIASNQWSDGISPWDYGLDSRYYAESYAVYFQTDKPIYRPGQTVYYKAIIRADDDARYSLDTTLARLPVTVTDPQGKEVFSDTVDLNEFGTFNGQFALDKQAALGYYYLAVTLPDNEAVGKIGGQAAPASGGPRGRQYGISFYVAEYRRPEFQVNVTTDKPAYVQGEKINAEVQATYFFGGAVANARVEWTVLAQRYWFDYQGQGWYDWTDEDTYYYYEGPRYSGSETIASGSGTTDAQGRLIISLPADLGKHTYSQNFTIDVSVTDINDQVVANRATATVHRGMFYIGLAPERYVGKAGTRQTVNIRTVDWHSLAYGQANLTITFFEREWFSVKEQSDYGPVWTWTYSDTAVFTQTVTTNEAGVAEASFVPESGGTYRIVATGLDDKENQIRSATYLWVSSGTYISWRQENNDRIQLVADKRSYKPGETASILIPSPFQGEVKALVTVERGRILSRQVITLRSNSHVLELPITPAMAPNAFVSVVIVKGVDATTPVAAFKMGYAAFTVSTEQQEIMLTITPDRTKYSPRDTVNYTIRATDYSGKPVQAEVALALVDLAVLTLVDPNSPPIVSSFYGTRGLGIRTGAGLVLSVDRLNVKLATELKGGGGGEAEGMQVRGDFRDTAYWNATVTTDRSGEARVSIKLPDNLTTWRLTARAVTADTLVGEKTDDIISTKDLLVRPVTPRFFIVGDKATLAAIVHNNTNAPLDVEVRLDAQGVKLEGAPSQTVIIKPNDKVRVEWPVVVQDAEAANLIFSARGGGLADASKPTAGLPPDQRLPIYKYSAPEVVATAGTLDEAGEKLEVIALPAAQKLDVTQGDLTVKVDASLAAGMVDGLTWLEHYPYECTEQTVSRFLPNVMTYRALKKLGVADPQLEVKLNEQVSVGLQRLYSQQHADGGWGWWVADESNPNTSAWVVLGLVKVREAGWAVDGQVIENGVAYLRKQLVAPNRLKATWEANRQAFLLYVLAEAGAGDTGRTVALYDDKRELLGYYGKAYLALALHLTQPKETTRINTLLSDLNNGAILSATGAHWEESSRDRWAWNTDTRSTAIILDMFARLDPQNALAPNVVRWLMVARTAGHWETTQETAWALIALTDWMQATGELKANYVWRVTLNGAELGSGRVTQDNLKDSSTLRKAVADLLLDRGNTLILGRSEGQGRLYYSAYLKTYTPVENVRALNRGIAVTRQYIRLDDPCLTDPKKQCTPVTSAKVGDVLQVRLTIVAPNDLYYAIVEDPLPAGAEALDTSLKTTSQTHEPPALYHEHESWGWWWFNHSELRDEKVALFATYLPRGTYEYTYLMRASVAGEFKVMPSTASEFYFPEVFGRSDGMIMTIK